MKNRINHIFLWCVALVLTSCLKDLDFDQMNNFESKPVYSSSLVYFDLSQTDFVIDNFEIPEVENTINFSLLTIELFEKQLEKLDLLFKVNNEFKRDFKIELDFLNNSLQVVKHLDPLEIPAITSNFEQHASIVIKDNPLFLTATKLKVKIQLKPSSDGSIINVNQQKKLSFKSAVDLYLKIQ